MIKRPEKPMIRLVREIGSGTTVMVFMLSIGLSTEELPRRTRLPMDSASDNEMVRYRAEPDLA